MPSTLSGQIFGGYTVQDHIQRGAFGDVYKGQGPDGTLVAIKFLMDGLNEDARMRFIREIQMSQNLTHPHILPILHYGYQAGKLFMIMPLIVGPSLHELLEKERFSPQDADRFVAHICGALTAGHAANIIHRDLKPENILVDTTTPGDYHYYLIDFGLAKRPGIDQTLTIAGASVGTPHYTAPESITRKDDQPPDFRADLYSLGVILYEMLLGELPFDDDNVMTIVRAHLFQEPPRPTAIMRNFPPELESVILSALAKDPAARPPSAEALHLAYQEALAALTPDQRTAFYWVR
ncbi:MAG: serine/threonine protein kinase [Anaerolineales bacterium]